MLTDKNHDQQTPDEMTVLTALASTVSHAFVTGAGGSIGSELVRQIAKFTPNKFILVDIYENNLYELQNELRRTYTDKPFEMECLIASVRDKDNIEKIMHDHRPEVVFHAAAHKHVPLMEDSPKEAIKNNGRIIHDGNSGITGTGSISGCSSMYFIS